jgi:hypothetical protein
MSHAGIKRGLDPACEEAHQRHGRRADAIDRREDLTELGRRFRHALSNLFLRVELLSLLVTAPVAMALDQVDRRWRTYDLAGRLSDWREQALGDRLSPRQIGRAVILLFQVLSKDRVQVSSPGPGQDDRRSDADGWG